MSFKPAMVYQNVAAFACIHCLVIYCESSVDEVNMNHACL